MLPLQPIQADKTFTQWGINLIGMINPPSITRHKWVLTSIDYFTRRTKAIFDFLKSIITRYGVPQTIIPHNAKEFLNTKIYDWVLRLGIYLNTSSNYYPQGNGLEESTKKNLIRIMKCIMNIN